MAESRRGLGRGLSALLGDSDENAPAQAPAAASPEGARELPIELIHANPGQPRRNFAESELAELEASIRDKGVLQPILVRPSPKTRGEYEIAAGERGPARRVRLVVAAPAKINLFLEIRGKRPDGSKHKFEKLRAADLIKPGYFGFQDHGQDCWYKNIKAKRLATTP